MAEVVVHGRTVDLSRSGAGLTLTRELPAGAEVVLCIQLPNSRGPLSHANKPTPGFYPNTPKEGALGTPGLPGTPLCLRAVVVRRRGFRAGLEFVQPTAEQRLLLCEFCYSSTAARQQQARWGPR